VAVAGHHHRRFPREGFRRLTSARKRAAFQSINRALKEKKCPGQTGAKDNNAMTNIDGASAGRNVRRDAPVICAGCGRKAQRRARQQRFCSDRCRDQARLRVRRPRMGRGSAPSIQNGLRANLPADPPKTPTKSKGRNWQKSSPPRTSSMLSCGEAVDGRRESVAAA
jgi:hypothetical protein